MEGPFRDTHHQGEGKVVPILVRDACVEDTTDSLPFVFFTVKSTTTATATVTASATFS